MKKKMISIAMSGILLCGMAFPIAGCQYIGTQDDIALLQAEIDEMQTLLNQKSGEIEQLQAQLKQQEENVEELQGELETQTESVEELQGALEQQNGTVQQLQGQLQQQNGTVQQLQGQLQQQNGTVQQLQGELEEQEGSAKQLQEQLEEQTGMVQQLQGQLESQKGKIQELENGKVAQDENIAKLETENEDLKQQIIELKNMLDNEDLFDIEYSKLTYVAFGDSITYGVDGVNGGRMESPYPKLVGETLGLKTVENKGVSGATFCSNSVGRTNMTENILAYTDDADIISVMLGVNDFAANLPLGTTSSTDNTTIYGSLYLIAEHFKEYYSDSFVFFMTPFPYKNGETKNSEGYVLEDVVNAIKYTCNKYDIPVLDMYTDGGYKTEMDNSNSDGTHPSQEFFIKYTAPQIVYFIKNNYR